MQFFSVLILIALSSVTACKQNATQDSELLAQTPVQDASQMDFSLARFLREASNVPAILKDKIAPGDAYVFVGDREKYDVQTNASLKTQGEGGFFKGRRGINAEQWLDAHIFGQRIGKKTGGRVVDVGASAGFDQKGMEVYFRFLGKDIYAGKVDSIYENSIIRDLTTDLVYYPLPLLGLKVGGNIGGEIGLRSEVGLSKDDMVNLSFSPRGSLHASLGAGLQVLAFTSAEIRGQARLLDLNFTSDANLGVVAGNDLIYGTQSLTSEDWRALDGKIEILAKAGMNALPAGVDLNLWQPLKEALGYSWSHTVWDPEPILVRKLPGFAHSFAKLSRDIEKGADCRVKVENLRDVLVQKEKLLAASSQSEEPSQQASREAGIRELRAIQSRLLMTCQL